ncbi:hypothetical protein K1T71_012166 [Dendrolimus kikuchii]|uniref:Uncharacterized protein n=1 Tax=Dendrolimus kikuchii TaxID=765133 RepID=A0ACC1CKT8_9NEOP|nr:hypothetical protein K1T71_012166 [Dendrolimus kikuchii]
MKRFNIFNSTELWQRQTSLPSIPTFSRSLDNVFGNEGIQLGSITEVLGLPGSGKTQLCLQLCASIQIPKVLGGLNAEALFIDTNTNFTVSRFIEILNASLTKCQMLLDTPIDIGKDSSLEKLHYVKTIGLEKFCAFLYRLPKFMEEHPNVKLIIIDSITFPFKEGISAKQRTGLLFRQMADLQRLTIDKQIAVVLTNEMSTRIGLSTGSVVGALGDAWSHRCNKRVLLSTDTSPSNRLALLLKSNDSPNTVGRFQVTQEGIRDIE